MKAYRIKGSFLMKDVWQPFAKEVIGNNEEEAKERLLSIMGSRHKVKRRMIKIEEVKELQKDEIEDAVIKYILERENE
ncbi:MAG: 50S ribosomal protein L18a [Thermoplasmata archaeon]|jgi:large subunit ribosomal protein LX|nr:50S ribosomal protein L18a [Thermoplasmata archaeon]